jgi:hypothetical protein
VTQGRGMPPGPCNEGDSRPAQGCPRHRG